MGLGVQITKLDLAYTQSSDWPGRAVTVRPARHAHKKGTPGTPVMWMGVPVPIVRQSWAGLGRACRSLEILLGGRAVPPCLGCRARGPPTRHGFSETL